MKFFLTKKYKLKYAEMERYFETDKPFYVFGELAVRGGDYYYGKSHENLCNTLAMNLYGNKRERICVSGKSLIDKDAIHIMTHKLKMINGVNFHKRWMGNGLPSTKTSSKDFT